MAETYYYEVGDILTVGSNSISIITQMQHTYKSEVYKVAIGDIGQKNYGLLKLIKENNDELKNTIRFYAKDTSDYMVEMITHGVENEKKLLLLKFYNKGSITSYLNKEILSYEKKHTLMHDILTIGCYLHEDNYLHADIKPDNFFIADSGKPRLGDLEFLTQLNDKHGGHIPKRCGTKGFKYSSGNAYDMQDEMFAYVATLYFIETNKILLSEEELETLDIGENPLKGINDFVIDKIEDLEDTSFKTFLLSCLDDLENNIELDCCILLEQYESVFTIDAAEEEEAKEETRDDPMPTSSIWENYKKPVFIGSFVLLAIFSIVFFYPDSSTHEETQEEPQSTIVPVIPKPIIPPEKVPETNTSIPPKKISKPLPSPRPNIIAPEIVPIPNVEEKPLPQSKKPSALAKKLRNLEMQIPEKIKVLDVNIPETLHVGDTLSIRTTAYNATGYLQILLLDPNDNQVFISKNGKRTFFLENYETLEFFIPTSKPAGLHYALVVFTAHDYGLTINNYKQVIQNMKNSSAGMEYIQLFVIDIKE